VAPPSGDSAAQADRSGKDAAVTGVWADVQDRWELLAPTGFGDEATLHDLVEKTPDLLPLAGRSAAGGDRARGLAGGQ
jgi:hypothetical protein